MKNRTSHLLLAVLVCLICLLSRVNASEFDIADSAIKHTGYPDWFKTSFLDLQEDIEASRENGKIGLMLLFTTQGCSYCDVFIRKSLGDPGLAALTRELFDSIGLEIFDDNEMTAPQGATMPVKQFAKQLGAEFSPTLVFLDPDGEILLKLAGYQSPQRFRLILDYFREGHHQALSFRDYARQLKNSQTRQATGSTMRDVALFQKPPYMLDRSRMAADTPLLVLFETSNCEQCDAFHNQVLKDQSIRKILSGFEVVRLDANNGTLPLITPKGDKLTPRDWFDRTGMEQLPAMLFFNEIGQEVLRTDALVLNQRMTNSLNYVLERAYEKNWTYQRFARTKSLERLNSQKP